MPVPVIKKEAEKHHISDEESSSKWREAKNIAKKEGKSNDFAYIMDIYKHLLGEKN
jgi:hypothetical protein